MGELQWVKCNKQKTHKTKTHQNTRQINVKVPSFLQNNRTIPFLSGIYKKMNANTSHKLLTMFSEKREKSEWNQYRCHKDRKKSHNDSGWCFSEGHEEGVIQREMQSIDQEVA